jgi:NDP-sugar pyrophosphorylase family protein
MVEEIRRVMGDGAAYGVSLRYAVEAEPLGTAGGVRNAVDLVGDLVAVLNGDILTDADLSAMLEFHQAREAAASIFLHRVPDPTPYGLVEIGEAGRIVRFTEKPGRVAGTTNTINAGIYLLDRGLLARIPQGRAVSIEREFFPGLLADRLRFFGWVGEHYWLDIGNPAKYRQGQIDLLSGRVSSGVAPASVSGEVRRIAEDATLDPAASITGSCVVGAGCRLEAGCRVGPAAVLGERCVVERDARVAGAILWDRVSVGPGAVLSDCIVASGARVGAGAVVSAGVVLEADRVVPDGTTL